MIEDCSKQNLLLNTLIRAEAKQWDAITNWLRYSHPRSHTYCSGAVLSLAELGRFSELHCLLKYAPDVRPAELCATLKCLISESGKTFEKQMEGFMHSIASSTETELQKMEKGNKSTSPVDRTKLSNACLWVAASHGFTKRQATLHPVLALHPDSSLVFTSTKRLHSYQIAFLVRYLLQWLSNITEFDVVAGGVPNGAENLFAVPSLGTIITWLTAVLDAGNMRLSTNESGMSVLENLMREVKLQVSCIKGLENLVGILEQTAFAPSKTPALQRPYTVESLSI